MSEIVGLCGGVDSLQEFIRADEKPRIFPSLLNEMLLFMK